MKELGYKIFAVLYRIFCIFPLCPKKVFLIMTHDAGPEGNVAVMRDYIKEQNKEYRFYELHREDTHFGRNIKKMLKFFIVAAYQLATSSYVFLDNMFLPMGYFHFRKNVKVVQMWHGTGVIKKIGADTNTGVLKQIEYRANQNNTHLIVSSKTTKEIYQKSFSMTEDKVFITGMPRTDVFFDKEYQKKALEQFYQSYPDCRNKKIILYAPTFRDSQVLNPVIKLDYVNLIAQLGEEYRIGLRLHPFVAKNRNTDVRLPDNVLDFSMYPSLNTLLFATDVLISDYSSIIFEYAALNKPMLFYAYDLEEFVRDGRGFYWDYEQYVPGPVVRTNEELFEKLKELSDNPNLAGEKYGLASFVQDTYEFFDSNSAKRLYQLLDM